MSGVRQFSQWSCPIPIVNQNCYSEHQNIQNILPQSYITDNCFRKIFYSSYHITRVQRKTMATIYEHECSYKKICTKPSCILVYYIIGIYDFLLISSQFILLTKSLLHTHMLFWFVLNIWQCDEDTYLYTYSSLYIMDLYFWIPSALCTSLA